MINTSSIIILALSVIITNIAWSKCNSILRKLIESLQEEVEQIKYTNKEMNEKVWRLYYAHETNNYHLSHFNEKSNTKNIDNVTLEELAKYVIDGEPIKREKLVTVTEKLKTVTKTASCGRKYEVPLCVDFLGVIND